MSKKSIYFLVIIIFMGGCSYSEYSDPLNRNEEESQNTIKLELKTEVNSKGIEDTLYVYLTHKWDELGLDPDQRILFFDSLKGSVEQRVIARIKALYTLHEEFKDYPQCLLENKFDSVNKKYGFYENEAVSAFILRSIDELNFPQQVE